MSPTVHKAAGVIEAKKQGVTLSGVETQSAKYTAGLPESLPAWSRPLPFFYQSTGVETRFTSGLAVVALDQIRTLVRTFRDKLFTEIFPGRTQVPKTLIFAKDDSHAEDDRQDRPRRIRQGNEFAEKITYRTTDASASPWKRFIKCKTTAQIPVRAVIAPRSSSSCTTATARASPPPQVSSPYASKGPNSMPASPSKLRLPQIEKVKLRRFSLFTANPDKHARRARGVKVPFTHGND